MKKFIILLLSFTLLFCSCRGSYGNAASDMEKLEVSNGIIYRNDTDISEPEYIASEELGYLYYGDAVPLAELDYLESYCIYMSRNKAVNEIHIFESKYQSDVDKLKRMLQSRADFLCELRINPNPSDFFCDTKADCKILSKGRFVFLVVGNTDTVADNIERLF